ncbi:MAG: hypothetical protein CW346_09310 [Bacillaceae bacterium]|nr:hypothetical protein [Bacillaceae bacterium]
MLDEQKIDDIFSRFIRSGSGSDEIKQIYETLPYLNNDQQRVLTLLNTLAVKYNSDVLREMAVKITAYAKQNRRTGFRFTRLIEAMSLYKHFKGYKMSGQVGEEKQ